MLFKFNAIVYVQWRPFSYYWERSSYIDSWDLVPKINSVGTLGSTGLRSGQETPPSWALCSRWHHPSSPLQGVKNPHGQGMYSLRASVPSLSKGPGILEFTDGKLLPGPPKWRPKQLLCALLGPWSRQGLFVWRCGQSLAEWAGGPGVSTQVQQASPVQERSWYRK